MTLPVASCQLPVLEQATGNGQLHYVMRPLALLLLLLAAAAHAQPVVIGSIDSDHPSQFLSHQPITFVDLAHLANRDGVVTTAAFVWSEVPAPAGCAAAVKIKFLRKSTGAFTVVAERGPFAPQPGYFTVALTPPVSVMKDDLLAVVQLLRTDTCGALGFSHISGTETMLRYFGIDLPSGNFSDGATFANGIAMMARASSDANVVAAVVPVVGSTAGGLTFFRTDLQAVNPGEGTITGKYVFHPAGRPAAPGDPSMTYSYGTFSATAVTDIVAAMGQTGLGSLDVVPTTGVPPRLVMRVYSDAGAAGTSGFTEESMTPDRALNFDGPGVLAAPANLANFRMNVGVRTLDDGATIRVQGVSTDITHTYAPNYFEQVTLEAFLGSTPVANRLYLVTVQSGSLFVYTTITDNRTNDSSIQFVARPR